MHRIFGYFDGPYIYKICKGRHGRLCFLVSMLKAFSYLEVAGLKDSLIVFLHFSKKTTLMYFLRQN